MLPEFLLYIRGVQSVRSLCLCRGFYGTVKITVGISYPPGQKSRYAARGQVYPTNRDAKAAAVVDAPVGEETKASLLLLLTPL